MPAQRSLCDIADMLGRKVQAYRKGTSVKLLYSNYTEDASIAKVERFAAARSVPLKNESTRAGQKMTNHS